MKARCDTCGNEYDKTFQLNVNGAVHRFDSFECAIEKLAPRCSHCGVRILGHGLEAGSKFFCCAHCAKSAGAAELRDRA